MFGHWTRFFSTCCQIKDVDIWFTLNYFLSPRHARLAGIREKKAKHEQDPIKKTSNTSQATLLVFSHLLWKKVDNKILFFFIFLFFLDSRTTLVPPIGLWTLSPRFLSGFTSPWAHDPFFLLVSGFPFQNTSLPVPWARDPFFPTGQQFPILKTRDFRFRSWRHHYIKTRLSCPNKLTLLLVGILFDPIEAQVFPPLIYLHVKFLIS